MAKNPWTGVDAIEADELSRIQGFYADALTQALKNQKKFLQKVKDVDDGKIKPPYAEEETGKIKKWREGFVREQMRQQKVIDGIMADINKAGQMAAGTISDTSVDIYSTARDVQTETLKNEAKTWLNREPNFAMYNKRQIGVLLQKNQSPFSKIAYQNLGQNEAIRRRLQNEMAIAIINGESQEKMMKRIRDVVGNAEYNARRTAQTERTRIQAQATHETATEAHAMGIRTYKKWSTRMINSRDNHIALNGACALTNELFKYSADGSEVDYPMMYPGDSSAPASEVCNCHCVYIEHVLLDDEDVQFGKIVHIDPAVGKKIAEESLGFEAFNEEVRQNMISDLLRSMKEDARNGVGDYQKSIDLTELVFSSDKYSYKKAELEYEKAKESLEECNRLRIEFHKLIAEAAEIGDYSKVDEFYEKYGSMIDGKIRENLEYEVTTGWIIKKKNAIIKTISEVRGEDFYSTPDNYHFDPQSSTNAVESVKSALKYYPESWINKLEEGIAKKRANLNANNPNADVGLYAIDTTSRGEWRGISVVIPNRGKIETNTGIHELAHGMEDYIEGIKEQEKSFYEYRTNGESLEWLGVGYMQDEVTKPDHFEHRYMGKYYNNDDDFELMSMGMEYEFGSGEHFTRDTEMEKWLIGLMLGL